MEKLKITGGKDLYHFAGFAVPLWVDHCTTLRVLCDRSTNLRPLPAKYANYREKKKEDADRKHFSINSLIRVFSRISRAKRILSLQPTNALKSF